ncbi:MAG: hypothetical protein ACKVVT_15525 [Dehalococcoidia bacterium]
MVALLGVRLALVPAVRREAIFFEGAGGTRTPVAPIIEALVGLRFAEEVSPTREEIVSMVRFARELDDGEAECGAVAQHRGILLATDDRKARRILGEAGVPLTDTPELLKLWATVSGIDGAMVSEVLVAVQRGARFRPRPEHPLYEWWARLTATQ